MILTDLYILLLPINGAVLIHRPMEHHKLYNCIAPFSINLSDITGIRQAVLYSTASASLSHYQYTSTGNVMTVLSEPNYSIGSILSNVREWY